MQENVPLYMNHKIVLPSQQGQKSIAMRTSIIVQNLKCSGCAKTIVSKLAAVQHISDVTVDEESATVSFVYKGINDVLVVKDKLRTLGYPSIDAKNTLAAKAISFLSCATGKLSKS